MLILVAGVTGNLGQHVGQAVLNADHKLRGLGRSPGQLSSPIAERIESFVTIQNYDDILALDRACTAVDAIICCYPPDPLLNLDGQLETYDSYLSFYFQARPSSEINPLYCACGVLAMTFFAVPRAGDLEDDKSLWVRKDGINRKINVLGTGMERMDWCAEADAAAFSVALVTSDLAEKGGFYEFCSDTFSLSDHKATYLKVHPTAEIEWSEVPVPVDQLLAMAEHGRKAAIKSGELKSQCKEYIGFVYVYHMLKRIGMLDKLNGVEKFPHVKRTSSEEYIRDSGIP